MTQIRLKLPGSKSEKVVSVCSSYGPTPNSQGSKHLPTKRMCSQDDLAEKLYLGCKYRASFVQGSWGNYSLWLGTFKLIVEPRIFIQIFTNIRLKKPLIYWQAVRNKNFSRFWNKGLGYSHSKDNMTLTWQRKNYHILLFGWQIICTNRRDKACSHLGSTVPCLNVS